MQQESFRQPFHLSFILLILKGKHTVVGLPMTNQTWELRDIVSSVGGEKKQASCMCSTLPCRPCCEACRNTLNA